MSEEENEWEEEEPEWMMVLNEVLDDKRKDRIMVTEEVAEMFQVSIETVRRWVRKGFLPIIAGITPYRFRLSHLANEYVKREGIFGPYTSIGIQVNVEPETEKVFEDDDWKYIRVRKGTPK